MLLLDFSKAIVRTTYEKAVFRSCVKFRGKNMYRILFFINSSAGFFL